jgi:hypothetical protein
MTQQVFTPKKYSPSWLPWIMNESETGSFVLAADFDFFMHLYQKQVVEIEALKDQINTLNYGQFLAVEELKQHNDLVMAFDLANNKLEAIKQISNGEVCCYALEPTYSPAD